MLEVVKISMESGLDIISLPSHTSHALQPLDVACFKSFKIAFKKIRDVWLLTNKNRLVEKQTLCEWTFKALQHALIQSNIQRRFRGTNFWPLNHEAFRASMIPSTGFKEGHAGLGKGRMTGLVDCSTLMGTRPQLRWWPKRG